MWCRGFINMGKIILFGATGLVGAYTAIHLKENGYDVVAVGHRKSDNGFFKENGIDYFSLDIRNRNDFNKLSSSNVDSVIHFAGAMPAHVAEYDASVNNSTDKIFEIPMAKINHRNKALKKHAMQWYKDKIDNLADFLFSQL